MTSPLVSPKIKTRKERFMKKFSTKLLSLLLVLSMLLTTASVGAAAANSVDQTIPPMATDILAQLADYDEAQYAQDAYAALSPEAREIFEQMLAIDANTREFHIENVDADFEVPLNVATIGIQPTAAGTASVSSIVSQLTALNLPAAVMYALEAVAAGIIAALADGPLPFGDALLIVATVGAAVVIAANWSSISSKWSSIVSVFTNAFSTIASTIISVFSEISATVPNIQATPSLVLNGKTPSVGGVTYNCQVIASSVTAQQKQQAQYYVAVIFSGNVYVDVLHPISLNTARLIVTLDNGTVGVFATSQNNAYNVVGSGSRLDPPHGGVGYYPHYHNLLFPHCHVWFT
jgi:hypothetical protein